MKMTRITASLKSKRFKHNINRKTYSFTVKFHYSNSTTIRSNTFVDYPTIEAAMRDCQRFEVLLQTEGKIRGFKPIVLRQTEPVIQRDDEAPIAGMFLQFQAQFYNNFVIMSLFYQGTFHEYVIVRGREYAFIKGLVETKESTAETKDGLPLGLGLFIKKNALAALKNQIIGNFIYIKINKKGIILFFDR